MKNTFILTLLFAACLQSCNSQSRKELSIDEIAALKEAVVIDVRTPEEFKAGHIADSRNIPLNVVADSIPALKRYKNIIFVCRSGNRSGKATALFKEKGFTNVYNGGGWEAFDKRRKAKK